MAKRSGQLLKENQPNSRIVTELSRLFLAGTIRSERLSLSFFVPIRGKKGLSLPGLPFDGRTRLAPALICPLIASMTFTLKRQLTVALENEPGRLAAISRILAEAGQSIHGLCVIDNIEQGVVRMLVSDPGSCADLLHHHGFYVVESEVLAISVPNRRGVFARVTRVLAENRINIDYAYLTAGEGTDTSLMVMKVSDLVAAEKVLVGLNESGNESPVI